jgi:hypothetical protein
LGLLFFGSLMSIYSNNITLIDSSYLSGWHKESAEKWNNYVRTQQPNNQQSLQYNGGYYGGYSIPTTTHNWGRFSNGSPMFSSSYLG